MEKSFGASQDPKIIQYVKNTFKPEDAILKEIRERSKILELPTIQVGDMDGLHLRVITQAVGAKKAVEIGTLGGYSAVCIARGLCSGGKLYTLEMLPEHAKVARESFKKANVEDRVEQLVGPALDLLPRLEKHGPFDLVFVDADKVNYPNYLKWAHENLRVGGVVLADNTFAWGMIADHHFKDEEDKKSVEALRKFNIQAAFGGHFVATMIPTGEGLTMAVKMR